MPRSLRPIAAAAAAVLLVGVPAVPAAAKPSHQPAHRSAHAKVVTAAKAKAKQQRDRLAGPRRAATAVIGAQVRALGVLAGKAATAADFTDADRAALQTALAAALDAARADLAAVPGSTSVTALRALMRAAQNTRTVALTQYVVVRAADGLVADGAGLTDALAALTERLLAASTAGTDVTGLQAAVDAASAQLTDALAQAPDAVAAILAVGPDATRDALRAAAVAAHTVLEAVSSALQSVQTAVTTAQDALTALGL